MVKKQYFIEVVLLINNKLRKFFNLNFCSILHKTIYPSKFNLKYVNIFKNVIKKILKRFLYCEKIKKLYIYYNF